MVEMQTQVISITSVECSRGSFGLPIDMRYYIAHALVLKYIEEPLKAISQTR